MWSVIRLVSAVGVALALFGVGGIAGVTYQQNLDECVSGTALHINHLPEAESEYSSEEIVLISSVSPVEQRIFLEAYTDEHDASSVYGNWTTSWFDDVQVIEYRGKQYELMQTVVDCGPPSGPISSADIQRT